MTRSRHQRTAALLGTVAAALCTVAFAPGVASAATFPEYALGVHDTGSGAVSPQGIQGSGKNVVVSPQGIEGSGRSGVVADPQGIQGTGR